MTRLSIFFCFCLFSSCISYKPIMITGIKDFKSGNFSGDTAQLSFNLEIDNPNGFKIVLKEYNLDVSINDKSLGKTAIDQKIVVKRKSKEAYPFKMNVTYKDFMAATIGGIGLFLKSEPVTLKLKGGLKGRIWWFKKNIPIDTTQKIKL